MKYVLMAISICFSVISSCLIRTFSNGKQVKGTGDLFIFNALISVVWTCILGVCYIASGAPKISGLTYIFGAVYGIILWSFLITKTLSLSEGPVSLTTLIGSCAFIIASWFGVIYANEKVNGVQLFGMVILIFSLALCINPKKSGEKLTAKWFLYAFLFFLAGGFVGILYKCFGLSRVKDEVNALMLVASVVSAVLFFAAGCKISTVSVAKKAAVRRDMLLFSLLCGIASCVYQRLNLSLSAIIPSVIFFPVCNGSMVILSTVLGRVIFKEALKPVQIAGIFTGLFSIILIGCSSLFLKLF